MDEKPDLTKMKKEELIEIINDLDELLHLEYRKVEHLKK